jgi:hypothetical protein
MMVIPLCDHHRSYRERLPVQKLAAQNASFRVFRAVKIELMVWVVDSCSVVVRNQHFGGPCCLCLQQPTIENVAEFKYL